MKHTLTVNRQVNVTKVALTGKLRAGKDAVARHLWLEHGFTQFAFGNALKRTAHEVFPWIDREVKPRKLYQRYGQTMRELDKNVWVRHVERAIGSHIEYQVGQGATDIAIVVTDLRQRNEYDWARANGFSIVRVNAPDELRIERAKAAGDDFSMQDLVHETELAIDGFRADYEIENVGSVAELEANVDAVLAEIMSKE